MIHLALLSGTLRTYQKAACDEEWVNIRCPAGTTISIHLATYGKTAPAPSLCRTSNPNIYPDLMDPVHANRNFTCQWPAAIQVFLLKMLPRCFEIWNSHVLWRLEYVINKPIIHAAPYYNSATCVDFIKCYCNFRIICNFKEKQIISFYTLHQHHYFVLVYQETFEQSIIIVNTILILSSMVFCRLLWGCARKNLAVNSKHRPKLLVETLVLVAASLLKLRINVDQVSAFLQ